MLGLLLGLFNGLVIVKLRLPPLTVTLGTFALYRGLAQALLKDQSIFRFPEWFGGIDTVRVAGLVPAPLLSVLALAAAHAFALHKTSFGRWTYSIGASQAASRLSGVPVGRAVILLFGWTGLMAALAGQMMTSRLGVARFDMGLGLELDAITAVVLGGTDIFGGRGRIAGTVLAVLLVGVLRTGMGLANWKAEEQLVVIGSLLVLSVALPNVSERWRGARAA
jgi:rhamnose transport system permease protein